MNRTGSLALLFAFSFLGFCLPLSIAGANIGWGLVAAALLLRLGLGERLNWSRHRSAIEAPLLAYLAAAILSCAFGTDPGNSFPVLFKDVHKLWLYGLFSVGLARLAEDGTEALLTPVAALAAGFGVSAVAGITQTFTTRRPAGLWERAHGFIHPVTFGEHMAFAVLGAFCFFEFADDRPSRKAPALALLGIASVALFLSQTRDAIGSAAIGFFTLAALLPRAAAKGKARLHALIAGAVATAATFGSDLLPTGRSLIESFSKTSAAANPQLARLTLWKVAWRMFRDHPWFGVGINNYRDQFGRYWSTPIDGEATVGNAHNLYIHQTAERGLLGALALAWLIVALCRRAAARSRAEPDALTLWALAATAAFVVMNMTEVALQVEQLWMLFFWIWILAEQRGRSAQLLQ